MTVPPWLAYNPKVGRPILNHGVVMDMTIMDIELFLTGFTDRYRPDQLKYFMSGFPKFSATTSFFDYHEAVVRHCQAYGCFIAPLHTLCPENPLGTWFLHPHLPTWVRQGTQTLSPTLAMALLHPSSGLATESRFTPFLLGGNGHRILYELAAAANHPLLTAQSVAPPEPKQWPDQTLVAYVCNWIHFMKQQLLVGIVYADRYFVDRVMAGMNAALRAQLDPEISDRRNMVGYGDPLPDALQPNALVSTFRQRAVALGHPEYLNSSPRALRKASQAVRALGQHPNVPVDATVHAIGTTRLCLLCSEPNHFLRDCPFLVKLNEPVIRKAIGLPSTHAVRQVVAASTDSVDDTATTPESSDVDDLTPFFYRPVDGSSFPPSTLGPLPKVLLMNAG